MRDRAPQYDTTYGWLANEFSNYDVVDNNVSNIYNTALLDNPLIILKGAGTAGSEDELISSESPPPSEVKVQAFLLVVNPQDALVLKHLLDMGGVFDFVLRAPTSDQLFNLQPVMSEYLIDRYQLEIPR